MSVREQLGRVIQFWRCKDKHKKIVPIRICPYLSDFVKKSHLAHLFSPNLSQESANRRLRRWIIGDQKLCEELRKVGFFDHQRDHFFTKKEVELLFEYIGEPCNWLIFNFLNNPKVSKCQSVKVSNSFRARKFAYKLYLKYIYFKSSKRHIWWCTLTLWHFDTLTPCSIVAYAFPQKHRIW